MLIDISKHNNLGNINEIKFMIIEILSSDFMRIEDIESYCLYNSEYIRIPVRGILSFLQYILLIEIQENSIRLSDKGIDLNNKLLKGSALVPLIVSELITKLINDSMFDINKIKYSKILNAYIVKNSDIPIKFSNLRNLMINMKIFQIDKYSNCNLVINNRYLAYFKNFIRNKRLIMNLEELKKQLIKQEKLGEIAELFVLKYELHRLQNHCSREKISRISEIDVTAGYDIVSFNSITSKKIDRYIEVKSYSRNIGFYWSDNEIKVSENLRDKYFIYLIDREKMKISGYRPIIIKNPYDNIYSNNLWSKEPQNWFVEPITKLDLIKFE